MTRWDVVSRSWIIFERNTTELLDLIKGPATDLVFSLTLMGNDRAATTGFWQELDQRLHNQLSSAVSLLDHTRRLTMYYADDAPKLVSEFELRNAKVIATDHAAFLRNLRNYLLRYGVPPIIQSLSLLPPPNGSTRHSIKLGATHLLTWDKWSSQVQSYIGTFGERDGPVIANVVTGYGNPMSQLYSWLASQREEVMRIQPKRFRMTPPPIT